MQIFRRKPFMLCCFCFIASFVTSFFVIGKVKLIAIYLFAGGAFAAVVLIICLRKKRNVRIKLTVLLIALIMSCAAFGESYYYYDIYSRALSGYVGKTVRIDVTVLDERFQETYYSEYIVNVDCVNGEQVNRKALLQVDGESGLRSEEKAVMMAEGVSLDEYSFSQSALLGYVSDGIIGAFYVNPEQSYDVTVKQKIPEKSLDLINKELTYKTERLVGGEAGHLSAAMLLGRRDRLSDETQRDFSRSGMAHVLALSGLHFAIIAGFFDLILKKLWVPKIIRCCALPTVMFGYLMLTGFTLSAVRAAVMLTAVYFAYIIASPIDKLTVLFASCALILALSPSAVADIGFWLSYVASLGLIISSPYISKILKSKGSYKRPKELLKSVLRYIVQSVLITLAAVYSVILLSQIAFGELSLVSPLANLICGPLVTAFLVLSLLMLSVGFIPNAEEAVASLIKYVGDAMLKITSYFSDIENASISLEYDFAKVLIALFTLSMAVLLVIKVKRKIFILLPAAVFSVAFAICFFNVIKLGSKEADITYIRRGESETVVIMSGVDTAFIDVGDGNYANYNAAWEEAHSNGATEIDSVVITHYHRKHGYSLPRLMSKIKVRRVFVPPPNSLFEALMLRRIYEKTSEHGVECVLYAREEQVAVIPGIGFKLFQPNVLKRSEQPSVAFEIEYGDDKLTYIGSSYFESKYVEIADEYLSESDIVVYGTHGPNPKYTYSVDPAKNAREIVFANPELASLAYMGKDGISAENIVCDCEIKKLKFEKYLNNGKSIHKQTSPI